MTATISRPSQKQRNKYPATAPGHCLFNLDLALFLVEQNRLNNSVVEDIGDINSTGAIHIMQVLPS
jgi:hypothetical protein